MGSYKFKITLVHVAINQVARTTEKDCLKRGSKTTSNKQKYRLTEKQQGE